MLPRHLLAKGFQRLLDGQAFERRRVRRGRRGLMLWPIGRRPRSAGAAIRREVHPSASMMTIGHDVLR
jgi:hypothetical protein